MWCDNYWPTLFVASSTRHKTASSQIQTLICFKCVFLVVHSWSFRAGLTNEEDSDWKLLLPCLHDSLAVIYACRSLCAAYINAADQLWYLLGILIIQIASYVCLRFPFHRLTNADPWLMVTTRREVWRHFLRKGSSLVAMKFGWHSHFRQPVLPQLQSRMFLNWVNLELFQGVHGQIFWQCDTPTSSKIFVVGMRYSCKSRCEPWEMFFFFALKFTLHTSLQFQNLNDVNILGVLSLDHARN